MTTLKPEQFSTDPVYFNLDKRLQQHALWLSGVAVVLALVLPGLALYLELCHWRPIVGDQFLVDEVWDRSSRGFAEWFFAAVVAV